MYHYVDATPPKVGRYAAGLTVRTNDFQAQMDYLAANGYHTVTLDQIYAAMAGGAALPNKPVAVTFDDGGTDNYTVAFPILRGHGFVATFFVITAFVGGANCLNWDQARVMQEAGMSIESHTVHHFDLRTLNPSQLASEMVESRRTIKSILGADANVVAYPSGEENAVVERAAWEAGYLMAVGTQPGDRLNPGSVFEWPRIRVSPGTGIRTFASIVKY
jgi:peptidoglycan/xylan/chitin deacetylase (PgdA/CDA1 family)